MTSPGQISRQYGVWDDTWNFSKRVTFIVDRSGKIRYVEVGSAAIDTNRALTALQLLAKPN